MFHNCPIPCSYQQHNLVKMRFIYVDNLILRQLLILLTVTHIIINHKIVEFKVLLFSG